MKGNKTWILIFICLVFATNSFDVLGQEDTTRANVSISNTDTTKFQKDTIQYGHNAVSPLDIGSTRGIFILSADRMLQLRIYGSVRANFNYTNQDLSNNQSFNSYEIPTDIQSRSPNFYGGVEETRLGFEVTRRTKNRGDIFIRLEGDFNNSSTSYRIRHAYGQFGGLLVGQTWSLYNNVGYQPALVSLQGPAGHNSLRTPQIRYSGKFNANMIWGAAIEYSSPNLYIPDSINGSLLQVIPDFTGSYSYLTDRLSLRVSVVISTISGRVGEGTPLSYSFGPGASFAGKVKIKKKGELFFSVSSGKSIAHFIDMFSSENEDMAYNPNTQEMEGLYSNTGYIAYSQNLPKNLSASLSFGVGSIANKDFQTDDAYSYSYHALLNAFWVPVDGAKVGIEFANGQRFDKGGLRGVANRLSMLIYYDF
jgi:hypothetical protein